MLLSPNVDGDTRPLEATDQLGFVVGAALAVDAKLTQLLAALLDKRAPEDGRKIVGDDDEGFGHVRVIRFVFRPH